MERRLVTTSDIQDGAITNDKIAPATITSDRLASNTIYIRAVATQIEQKTGLDATTLGIKARSPVFKFSAQNSKQLILRSSITAIPADATVRIGVYNITTGSYILTRDYTGTVGEFEDILSTGLPADGDLLEIRVEVITAGAAGTFDVGYAILMIDYGIS